jgi:hypothetical protein
MFSDLAVAGELERVRQQVLQDLLQARRVGHHRGRQVFRQVDLEAEVLGFGHVAEGAVHVVAQVREAVFRHVQRDGTGLDLRQVENVVNQGQQVGAGAVDGLREFHLLARQVALGVVRQLLREDQQRVQWRAQLVRHIRQELGLVLRGQRQLGRLFFQRQLGLLHLAVLAFHLDVLLGQQARLFRQFLVGLLQFLRQRLRLGQQRFGTAVRLDRVQHDADRFHQLVEEGEVGFGEAVQRRDLDDGLDLLFEQDRQHDDVGRRRRAQARRDDDVVARHVGQPDAALLQRALAHQAFARQEGGRQLAAGTVAVRRDHAQARIGFLRVHHVEHAVVRRDQRRQLRQDQLRHRPGRAGPAAVG